MRALKKLSSFVLVLTLLSALLLTGCGNKKDNGEYVFKIGTANGSLCLAPIHIAVDNGYFEEEFKEAGVKYELVEIDLANVSDLVASKKIDASLGLAGSLIPQIDSGLEIAFTTGIHTGCTKYYVPADSDINDMSDLKGKKIGVPSIGDSSVIALKRILHDLGIGVSTDNMEVELVVYNLTDLPLALDNGAVDAVALHDPVAASAYTRAIMKASAYVQAEPENSAKLQIDNNQCSGDLENNAKLLASYNYQPSVSAMEDTFRNACTELLEIGDLKEGRDINKFTSEHVAKFNDVPDSYVYNDDGTFSSVESKKNDCCG